MTRILPWIIAAGCAGWAAYVTFNPGHSLPFAPVANVQSGPTRALPIQTPNLPPSAVVHTFNTNSEIQEFEQLWQQRDDSASRMLMLQIYWDVEQTALQQLDATLLAEYSIDQAKSYKLDTTERTLSEIAGPETAQPDTENAEASEDVGAPEEPILIHTFPTDEALQQFTSLWSQRRQSTIRMGSLKTYWNLEQQRINTMNAQLTERYNVDPTKDYAVNQQQATLIEFVSTPSTSAEETAAP